MPAAGRRLNPIFVRDRPTHAEFLRSGLGSERQAARSPQPAARSPQPADGEQLIADS